MNRFLSKYKIIICLLIPLCFLLAYVLPVLMTQRIPVLLYHHILTDEENTLELDRNNPNIITPAQFEEQMKYMHDHHFRTITLSELDAFLYEKKPLPRKSFMVSFDDGYVSNLRYAYPVLKQYNFTGVIFAITGNVTKYQRQFNPNELTPISLESMAECADVFEYASHTHNMHYLKDKKNAPLTFEPKEAIMQDLEQSLLVATNKTALAYPYGQYTPVVIDCLKELGFKMAFTINGGYITQDSNPYELNRFSIFRDNTLDDVIRKVNPPYIRILKNRLKEMFMYVWR